MTYNPDHWTPVVWYTDARGRRYGEQSPAPGAPSWPPETAGAFIVDAEGHVTGVRYDTTCQRPYEHLSHGGLPAFADLKDEDIVWPPEGPFNHMTADWPQFNGAFTEGMRRGRLLFTKGAWQLAPEHLAALVPDVRPPRPTG